MTNRKLLLEIPFPFKGEKLQIYETWGAAERGGRMWQLTVRARDGTYVSSTQCRPHPTASQIAELLTENKESI